MDISERKKKILKSVIDAYIATGEPVGSKLLSSSMSLSSATIRNEMSELEQLGFLEQLHTSSGRVPSDKGYRLYVDSLLSRYRMSLDEIRIINSLLDDKLREFREIVGEASRLLSGLTGYTAVSMTAKQRKGSIRKFEAVYISEVSFVLIMITSHDVIKTGIVKTPCLIDQNAVEMIAASFNKHLASRELTNITLDRIMAIENDLGAYREAVSPAMRIIYDVIEETERYTLNVDGASNLLEYPEFSDISKAKELLSLLEEKETLLKKLTESDLDSLNVYIGDNGDALDSASFIVRTFTTGDGLIGAVGIIGPKRMDYSGVIARLEYMAGHFLNPKSEDVNGDEDGGQ